MYQKPKGTIDYYPDEQGVKNAIFDSFRRVCWNYGFKEVEGPAIENFELIKAKSGEEIKSQMFMIEKKGEERLALRAEFTPSLARMFMQKQKELQKPVKWFACSRVWRYERPQAGRLREFYQMNVELYGSGSMSADAEVINLAIDFLKSFGLTAKDFVVKLNNRKLLQGLVKDLVRESQIEAVIRIIDKKSKVSDNDFNDMLNQAGVKNIAAIDKIFKAKKIEEIGKLPKNKLAEEGYEELKAVYELLDKSVVRIDLSTARGLAYYTGTVFEIHDSKGKLRSICGGGRYDTMIEQFGGQSCPATGFGLGLATFAMLLEEKKLTPKPSLNPDYYVAVVSENVRKDAMKIVSKLREENFVEVDLMERSIGKQISHANALKAKNLIVFGEDEVKSGEVKIKDMETGKEKKIKIKDL
jgi:histidyl-tRNA synthetase